MSAEKKDVAKLLSSGKSVEISPEGYSMYPLIIPGRDWVTIQPFVRQRDRVRVGDVILFRRQTGLLVIHRVWRVLPQGAMFCGDNQTELEGVIFYNQMLGRVSHIKRKGKRFSVGNPLYRLYVLFWIPTRRLRPAMHVVAEFFRTIRRLILREDKR